MNLLKRTLMSTLILICKLSITLYMSIYMITLSILPTYIYIKSINYKNFVLYEYVYNNKKKTYVFNHIELKQIKCNRKRQILLDENDIIVRDLINHCCVLNKNDEYMRDITYEIKKFMHLNNKIMWSQILLHLSIYNENIILFNMNDDDLSEIRFNVNELIKDDCLFSI